MSLDRLVSKLKATYSAAIDTLKTKYYELQLWREMNAALNGMYSDASSRSPLMQTVTFATLPLALAPAVVISEPYLGAEAYAQQSAQQSQRAEQSPQYVVIKYDLATGQPPAIVDIGQRLAPNEFLKNFTGINIGDNKLRDFLLGKVLTDVGTFYLNETDRPNDRIDLRIGPEWERIRHAKFRENGIIRNVIYVFDGATQIYELDLKTGEPPKNKTQEFEARFGFQPIDIVSINIVNDIQHINPDGSIQYTSPEDDIFLLQRDDRTYALRSWQDPTKPIDGQSFERLDLEGLINNQNPGLAGVISITAANPNGGLIDDLYIIMHPRSGTIADLQAAEDIFVNNTIFTALGPIGRIARWEEPVRVVPHPSVSKDSVNSAMWRMYLEYGITYIPVDFEQAPRLLYRVGTTEELRTCPGCAEIKTGTTIIREDYLNGRLKLVDALIRFDKINEVNVLFDEGGVHGTGDGTHLYLINPVRARNMKRELYKLPHGAVINRVTTVNPDGSTTKRADGTWKVE